MIMNILLSIFLTALLLVSCHSKSVPVITSRDAPPLKFKNNTYPPIANVAADTAKGKALYNTACGKCHSLPTLTAYNQQNWEGYLSSMFPRTNLTTENAYHVRAYVLAFAAK